MFGIQRKCVEDDGSLWKFEVEVDLKQVEVTLGDSFTNAGTDENP